MIASMVCLFTVTDGDCVILKDAAGQTMGVKSLPAHIHYDTFARRVMHSKRWSLVYSGPGAFHFTRKP